MSQTATVYDRNVWIVEYLQRTDDPRKQTIRTIWEAAKEPPNRGPEPGGLGDSASLPTYHRTIAKLVRQGQVEEAGEQDGAVIYKASPHLSSLSTYTLTDLNAALWELSVPEAIANYVDAVDYYEARAGRVLRKAGERLLKEDPRELIIRMLKDLADELSEDIAILSDPNAHDQKHRAVAEHRLAELRNFVHSELGLNGGVWAFPQFDGLVKQGSYPLPDWAEVARAVSERVIGQTFVERVDLGTEDFDSSRAIVAGTDGSSHVGYVRGIPAPRYVEEQGRLVLVFNNSIAYVELPDGYPEPPSPYHGIPMTRAALEDPQNRGMVLSRPWFDDLTDSEFEHFKKTALDVVQFRVDDRLLNGTARAYGAKVGTQEGGLLPKPNVLIRDGTVTPQEREFQHYCLQNAYGEMVREGITRSYSILRAVRDSKSRVYAGAVKQTQLRTFARIINWYIKREIDPEWDLSKVSTVTDTVAVTRLIDSLPPVAEASTYYATCMIIRPFPAMVTGLRTLNVVTRSGWMEYFRERQAQQRERWQVRGEEPSWFLSQDVEDDVFVRLCADADYASFYFGRPGEEPELTLPRFEFMDSLRYREPQDRVDRAESSRKMIVVGVHRTKWALDREHNFMTRRKMPRLIPYVIYNAHEKCKALGHKLESELRQAIAMRLSQLKALRGLPVPKVEIEPVPVQEYLEQLRPRLLDRDKGDYDSN